MDYVVFGTGYGATLMLLGWVLRTFGPDLRYQLSDDDPPATGDFLMARTSWRRFAAGLGAVIATAGMTLVFITIALILANPGNAAGIIAVLIVVGATLIAVAVWTWIYIGRYGTHGLMFEWPRKAPEPEPAPVTAPAVAAARPLMPSKREAEVAAASAAEEQPADAEEDVPAAGDDAAAIAQVDIDEEALAELEARMARYHVHHPDGSEVTGLEVPEALLEAAAQDVTPSRETSGEDSADARPDAPDDTMPDGDDEAPADPAAVENADGETVEETGSDDASPQEEEQPREAAGDDDAAVTAEDEPEFAASETSDQPEGAGARDGESR